jgi:hypothetical protein
MAPVDTLSRYQERVFFVDILTLLSCRGPYMKVTSSVRETFSCSQVKTNMTKKSRMLMAVARPMR